MVLLGWNSEIAVPNLHLLAPEIAHDSRCRRVEALLSKFTETRPMNHGCEHP